MADFIPRRDETLESDPHQKWQTEKIRKQGDAIAALRADLDKLLRANATSGKQVAGINGRVLSTDSGGVGLPPGGVTSMVPRKKAPSSGGSAIWTREWQGLLPEYYVSLSAAGGSYTVSGMGIGSNEAVDEDIVKTLLPPVLFDDGGLTMLPLSFNNFPDNDSGFFNGRGQWPIHLAVDVYPAFDGEEFTINVPVADNSLGITTPYYTFELSNYNSSFDAVVHIAENYLYYAGTNIPVNGSTTDWSVPSGAGQGWHVQHVKGWGAAVHPVMFTSTNSSDPWYDANVLHMRQCFEVPKDGALSVATIPRRMYNSTVTTLGIGKVVASVGTAPSGADLTMVVKKNGSSISSSFTVASGANTGSAVLTDTAFAPGDYITIEVTQTGSAADLNVQIWAG